MEENLMEKLLTDFDGTLNEFNELVNNNDFEGVRRVLDEVNRLLQERNGIVLDDREPQYDHVLHELLDKMTGIVEREITIQGVDGVPGLRYYTNKQVEEMIAEAEEQLREITRMMEIYEEVSPEAYAQARSDRSAIIARIAELRAALVEGQEYSTLTYIDSHLAELQEERARLLREKEENLREIERLRAEETPGVIGNPGDQARLNEINGRLSELENIFSNMEGQINTIRETNIRQLIDNLRAQNERNPELEARRAELQERLRQAGERVRETRGFDEQNADARAEYSAIVSQISNIESEINGVNQNSDNIEFLETLLPEVEERENVLNPMDYTYMGRLSDEQIIRRLLSEELHLSEEEINATIGEYSLVQAETGAHDEYGEDNQISMRQLVRTRTVKGDRTVGEALDALEAQLNDGQIVDHAQEISEIDSRIEELDKKISDAERRIEELSSQQISDIIAQIQENQNRREELEARRAELQERLRQAGERVRETRGFDEQNAYARAEYSAIVSQISNIESEINRINQNSDNIEFLETLLPEIEERENVLNPMDYTYMGRLSDEQIIRRLLSEELHLSEEEINATIGEYSLVQAELGAHDEYGEDNPISMRQLVRTRKVKQTITVKEGQEKLDQEISELEARRAELQERLKQAGERVRETRGFDEQNAYARAEYSELVRIISEIESQLAGVRERKIRLNDIVGIKKEEEKIATSLAEKENLLTRKKELEQDSSRQENSEIREKINRLKEISGIAALEAELQQYKDEYERLQKEKETLLPTQGKTGIDNSEKIAALEARNREIDARIAEIDKEIADIIGTNPPKKETERIDIEKEAHKIGDHVFKTAAIRRELAARHVSRDEFLEFYKAGLIKTNEQIDKLSEEYQKYLKEIRIVLNNPEDTTKRIDILIKEAEKEGNQELATKLYEQMRKNFIAAGREEQLKDIGLDHEITTPEDVEKMKTFFATYRESVKEGSLKIKTSIEELKENAAIFSKEIERINAEKVTIELAGNSLEDLKNVSEARKNLRKMLLEASITPKNKLTEEQKELIEKWQEASERFLSKKVTAEYKYTDKDGVEKVIDVDSIDDTYQEYASDIEFLGVPAYKENLEQISAWNQTKDPYVLGKEVGKAFEMAEAQREGAGQEIINRIIADKQKYVETFNGIPNPHKVKYENWKTAGSTLKGMKPVNRGLPMQTRAKNVAENVFRFLGIRPPKFSRIDEHGNKVRDVKSGVATLVLDGLVIGAVTATTLTLGPGVAAIGYAAKGIVTVGNRVAARVEYARHKDEIDNNKPSINQADRNAREVARKQYYRDQGNNRFVSWVKAKSDKYFTRKRERETEAAIVDKLYKEYSESEDKRTEILAENLEIAEANQKAREDRQKQIAMGANTYNDIVRDPDTINKDEATATIARNAALEANKPGAGKEDINKDSKEKRKSQYIKQEGLVDKTSDLNEEIFNLKNVDGPISAITAEQIYTGRKQYVDRLNRVLTVITAAGLKFAHTAWKEGFMKEDTIHHPAEYEDKTIHHPAEYEDKTIHHPAEYEDKTIHHPAEYEKIEVSDYEIQYDTSKTLEELRENYSGDVLDQYYSVSGGLRGKVTTEVPDRGITALWVDDNTRWGTGVSDIKGLTAPEITDRIVASNLLDVNGMLRQDITVGELINSLGASKVDLTTLDGVYASVGDEVWVSLKDLMEGMTRNVPVGTHIEDVLVKEEWNEIIQTLVKEPWDEIKQTLVKEPWDEVVQVLKTPAWDETIKNFSPDLMINSLKDGAVIGASVGLVDSLHEAAQTTYIDGMTPGRPQEVTPEANDSFDNIANKIFEKAREEAEIAKANEEKDERE